MSTYFNNLYAEIIKAFRKDCELLIKAFQDKQSELFQDFVLVWKAFGFNLIYDKYNKEYYGDVRFIKEDSLQIAKSIMLKDNFVGGMYLLYSLYYMQEDPKASIRIELSEFKKIKELLKEERTSTMETCQPGYIYAKLLKNDAFSFVTFSREFSFEGQSRARMVFGSYQATAPDLNKGGADEWFNNFLKRADVKVDVGNFEKQYLEKKQKIESDFPELNLTLDMKPQDLITGLSSILKEDDTTQEVQTPVESIGSKRKSLKSRKMIIKHRYEKPTAPDTVKEEENLTEDVINKYKQSRNLKRFLTTAKKRHYEETSSGEEEEDEENELSDSTSDDPILALPDID